MNNSKKTIKGPQPVKKTEKKTNPKLWIIPSIILGALLIVAILFDQLYERVLITIDDDKYHLSDLTYYIYNVESYYDSVDQYYASLGGSYWDQAYDETSGITMRDVALQEAASTAVYNEVMYQEAVAAGYNLTEEESKQIATDITSLLYERGLSKDMIKENGFTDAYLTDIMGRIALSKRYKEDIIKNLNVDNEAIEAKFVKEDYRQYDFDYLYISTQTTDDSGNKVAMDKTAKKASYDKMKAQYDKALETEDWSTLIAEGEEELKFYTTYILENQANETNYANFTDEFRTMVKGMENDTVSEIFEDEEGYYIVRMLDNNATESYDQAVENAITSAEEEAFQVEYNENILPKHEYKINNRELKRLRMGSITLN